MRCVKRSLFLLLILFAEGCAGLGHPEPPPLPAGRNHPEPEWVDMRI